MKFKIGILVGFSIALSACGGLQDGTQSSGALGDENLVVKSRVLFSMDTGNGGTSSGMHMRSAVPLNGSIPISVVNAASASMTINQSLFLIPPISNQVLDFGYLQITALNDNDLKVCGSNGKQKCNTAVIRMYTTGTAEAGFYNADEGYGVPISAGQSTLSTVGLNSSAAVTLQTYTIPNNQHVVTISNFPNAKYNVQSDFRNAGSGNFSTTLVLEYALAP